MKYSFFLITILVLTSLSFNANSQMIKGKVLNEKGYGASNITVKFTNKANKVITNKDGSFSIMASKLPDTLIFNAEGYEPYKVVVTEKTVIDKDFSIVLLTKREKGKSYYASTSGDAITSADLKSIASVGMSEAGGLYETSGYSKKYTKEARTSKSAADGSSGAYKTYATPKSSSSYSDKKIRYITDEATTKDVQETYATKLLTAGEVNDFNKWKMWEDFTDNEFKVHANNWKLYVNQRYSVQVQHKSKYAAVGVYVYLLNAYTKDTVWRAVTDNTGKAELWANIGNANKEKNDYIIVCKGSTKTITKPYLFHEGINRLEIETDCNTSNKIDIAFVVDATGSMGDEIDYLKLELEDVLTKTFEKYNNVELRAASVFYRDLGDEYVTKHIDFNTDLLKVLNFIKLQSAEAGGDVPEAVDAALATALDSLNWSKDARTKIMFLILDAPPHQEAQAKMFKLIQKAAAMGIRVVPIVCSGADKSTEFLMRSIALATNGTYVFLTNHSGIGKAHIEPTTDSYNVELLNDLLPRIIQQMVFVNSCNTQQQKEPLIKVDNNILKVKASPNPTKGNVTITANKPLKDLFIADFTGKILMKIPVNAKQTSWTINIAHFPAGTYIVRYVTTNNEWGADKVVLVH